jgi:tetratricopeptide (TPR) repeat protein
VIFLDACRNDPFRGKGLKPNLMTDVMARDLRLVARGEARRPEPPTAVLVYSCQVGEQSFEDPDLQGGVFTHFVVKGIEALADKPDGRVEAGKLAAYLSENVKKRAEEKGKFQSPTMVAIDVRSPVVVVNASPFAESVPAIGQDGSVLILPTPDDARIFVDGLPAGSGRMEKALSGGEHTIRAEREGFQPVEAKVFVQGGYRVEAPLTLKPTLAKPEAQERLERALDAERSGLFEQAIALYKLALQSDPDSKVATTRLACAYVSAKRWRDAAIVMYEAYKRMPGDPALSAAFARAFADWASSDDKEDLSAETPPAGMAKKKDARREALKVAEAAAKSSPASVEAQLAFGYVLLQDPKDRRKALDAFVAASIAEPGNAEAYFYAGLTHRLTKQYAQAVPQLKKALELRPDYYDAHLELAYCHHALGQTADAKREYEIAASMRTESDDQAQMASTHVALSAIYAQQAEEESKKGNEEQAERYRASSEGYTEEAKTFDPDLKAALRVLAIVGLENRIREFLPGPLRTLWDALRPGGIGDIIRGGIRPPIPPSRGLGPL